MIRREASHVRQPSDSHWLVVPPIIRTARPAPHDLYSGEVLLVVPRRLPPAVDLTATTQGAGVALAGHDAAARGYRHDQRSCELLKGSYRAAVVAPTPHDAGALTDAGEPIPDGHMPDRPNPGDAHCAWWRGHQPELARVAVSPAPELAGRAQQTTYPRRHSELVVGSVRSRPCGRLPGATRRLPFRYHPVRGATTGGPGGATNHANENEADNQGPPHGYGRPFANTRWSLYAKPVI